MSGLNIIGSLRLTDKTLDRNVLCAFLNVGHSLRQGSHQLNSCEKDSVERFSWIGFVAVTLVWSLLESKERSSLQNYGSLKWAHRSNQSVFGIYNI